MKKYNLDPSGTTGVNTAEAALASMQGAFVSSLTRNNKQIKTDRAVAIAEDAEMIFKRTVEDIETKLKRMRRDRENMLDLSPGDKMSLTLASDFDATDFVQRDLKLGVDIRNEEIKLAIAKERYNYLFGNHFTS